MSDPSLFLACSPHCWHVGRFDPVVFFLGSSDLAMTITDRRRDTRLTESRCASRDRELQVGGRRKIWRVFSRPKKVVENKKKFLGSALKLKVLTEEIPREVLEGISFSSFAHWQTP